MGLILGPLIGAGAGSYFGLKGALNGLKESARRADGHLEGIKDISKEALLQLVEHRKESRQFVTDLKQDIREK